MKTLLDLFCGAGGCSVGYNKVGFKVIGVDIEPQPNYPFEFIQSDALTIDLSEFDVIHASPPCQKYSNGSARWRKIGYEYFDLIGPIRVKLITSKKPYIIENVVGAPLINPIILCGTMFGLNIIRHRLFESNFSLITPAHPKHLRPIIRKSKIDESKIVKRSSYCEIAGGGGDSNTYKFDDWKKAMGIDWMTKKELIQAIPPSYTEYIGKQIYNYNGKISKQVNF